MNNFIGLDTRNRRNLNSTFPPIHVPVSNYSTKAQTKESMNDTYNTMIFNKLHLIPDPLKKNLADSVITGKDTNMTKTKEFTPKEVKKPPSSQRSDFYPKLRNIISGVFNVMGAMFQWRDSSPASQYYDCFEGDYIENSEEPMSGSVPWQAARCDIQNKNDWARSIFDDNNETHWNSEMTGDCSPALTDDQINQVCLLLNSESNYIQIPNAKSKPFESSSVDVFEDAFCPDELNISGDSYLEYHSPLCYQEELFNSYSSNVKPNQSKENISEPVKEMTSKPDIGVHLLGNVEEMSQKQDMSGSVVLSDSVKEMIPIQNKCEIALNIETHKDISLPQNTKNETIEMPTPITVVSPNQLSEPISKPDDMLEGNSPKCNTSEIITTMKDNVVSSCEGKLNRLKALLKSKCSKQKDSEKDDNNITTVNKPENIVCDILFGEEINIPSTACLRLAEPFNEVTGKFYSSSVESDDSFQIVFTDNAKESRCRIPSECESEDSFIVFEESPDSCYISDDVFGNVQFNHYCDSETSDSEDDSGCESTLCPGFSRTVEDLTDCKLYDEVDSSTVMGQHYHHHETYQDKKTSDDRPRKKVHFSSEPPKVHVMRVWAFAARQARIGEWEQHARDRERFKSRINDVEMAISWVLKPQHRRLVMFQRFMPWWNAQKRKEQEEKKQLELAQQMEQHDKRKVELDSNKNIKDVTENRLEQQVTKEKPLQYQTLAEDKNLKGKEQLNKTENIGKADETKEPEEIHVQDKRKRDIDEKKAPYKDDDLKDKELTNETDNIAKGDKTPGSEDIEKEDNSKLEDKRKAPERATSQGTELDDNHQIRQQQTSSYDYDISHDSAPTDPSSQTDR